MSSPSAPRPRSGDFESELSTRPSTSLSDGSNGNVSSDSTRTSSEDYLERNSVSSSSSAKAGQDKANETMEGAQTHETETEAAATNDAPEKACRKLKERSTNIVFESEHAVAIQPLRKNLEMATVNDDGFGDFEEADDVVSGSESAESRTPRPCSSEPATSRFPSLAGCEFVPDLSLIGQLFPPCSSNNQQPAVDTFPIDEPLARQAWHRLTRTETLRQLKADKDHGSYIRVCWQGSTVHAQLKNIVGRWLSEDHINVRTPLVGRPSPLFGWDSPKVSPASSTPSLPSHKHNASTSSTPNQVQSTTSESRKRPWSLAMPLQSTSTESNKDNDSASWSCADQNNMSEIIPISAPRLKTVLAPEINPETRKLSEPSESHSIEEVNPWQPAETPFEHERAWSSASMSLATQTLQDPFKTPVEEEVGWESMKSPADESRMATSEATLDGGEESWKSSVGKLAVELPLQPPTVDIPPNCRPVKNSQGRIVGWKSDNAVQTSTPDQSMRGISTAKLSHARALSDPNTPHTDSPVDSLSEVIGPGEHALASSESEQVQPPSTPKKAKLNWLRFSRRKKNSDLAHGRSVSTSSFLAAPNTTTVTSKNIYSSSLGGFQTNTTAKSPLATELPSPDPRLEPSRRESDVGSHLEKHVSNPWDNAFDNAWDDAKQSVTTPEAPDRDGVLQPIRAITAIDAATHPEIPTSATKTNAMPSGLDIPNGEETSGCFTMESPDASSAIVQIAENPWDDQSKLVPVPPAIEEVSTQWHSTSRPATQLSSLDTGVECNPVEEDDDDWGEMVESPVITPPSVNLKITATKSVHTPTVLTPMPISPDVLSIAPTTLDTSSPPSIDRRNSTSPWMPKPTNYIRPLSPLNPARSSTFPLSPSATSPASPLDSADAWDKADLSILDTPTASPSPCRLAASSHVRTASSPAVPSHANCQPVVTFDRILQPSRGPSGSATTFDDILARPGQLSPASLETDDEIANAIIAGLPDLSYMLR